MQKIQRGVDSIARTQSPGGSKGVPYISRVDGSIHGQVTYFGVICFGNKTEDVKYCVSKLLVHCFSITYNNDTNILRWKTNTTDFVIFITEVRVDL